MFSKTVVIVAIVCSIQGFRCETTIDVVEEYKPKIDQLKDDIDAVINKTLVDINLVQAENKQKVNASMVNAISKINTLRQEAKDALEVAQEAGQDIEACIKAIHISLGKLNLGLIAKCYGNENLAAVQAAVGVLVDLQKNADGIIDGCVEKYPTDYQVKQLRICLIYGIRRTRVEVRVVQGGINFGLNKAVESTIECVSEGATVVDEGLVQISEELSKCVETP